MVLLFSDVCKLLSTLEGYATRDCPNLAGRKLHQQKQAIRQCFSLHGITSEEPTSLIVALLSALLPAKRTERVYGIQRPRLVRLLKRWLSLGTDRQRVLDQWKIPGRGDLGDCVERVMRQTDDHSTLMKHKVDLEQVDVALTHLASRNRFSGMSIKEHEYEGDVNCSFESIFTRLHSSEAKWLTRMILKDFTLVGPEAVLLYSILDVRLPDVMRMYDDLKSGVAMLKYLATMPNYGDQMQTGVQDCTTDGNLLSPRLGIKVGPAKWIKAKGGVNHAISIIDGRKMSVERKYDGEYCQVHLDLSMGDGCVQIFSKSGKDSTTDRVAVHDAIKDSFRIGTSDCDFAKNCIVEGELLVWSDKTAEIMDFHKIRKHISRSGSFLGTEKDSQPHPWEHLMIVFFDVLLVDDEPVLHRPYKERQLRLRSLVTRIEGKAEVVWQRVVDFSRSDGPKALNLCLANALAQRWEGLVLKPLNESYFAYGSQKRQKYSNCWVKLKKDCIDGLGDTADIAIVGAAYDPKLAATLSCPYLSWTHFFLAGLTNKDDVLEERAKPSYFIFDCVYKYIKTDDIVTLNQRGRFMQMKPNSVQAAEAFQISSTSLDSALPKLSAVFKRPFVCEVAGSGFEKASNSDVFTLRFPRVLKIHWDRDWKHAVSLVELQEMAAAAGVVPSPQSLEQEVVNWQKSLDHSERVSVGKMNATIFTDDEGESQELTQDAVPIPITSQTGCYAPSDLPLPNRMTSKRLAESESHCGDGCVFEQRASTGIVSKHGSFPGGLTKTRQGEKRGITTSGTVQQDRPPKRARLPSLASLGNSCSESATRRMPLQNNPNLEQPTVFQGLKSTAKWYQMTPRVSDQMRKGSIEAVAHFPEMKQMTKERIGYSSRTIPRVTASLPRSSTISQRVMDRKTHLSQCSYGSKDSSQAQNRSKTDDASPTPISSCPVVLNPSLRNRMPDDLCRLLPQLAIQIPAMSFGTTADQIPTIGSSDASLTRILFLVDSDDASEVTASALRKLAPRLKIWHSCVVQVWDWRVVYITHRDYGGLAGHESDIVTGLFIAEMSLIVPYDGDEGSVFVRWADGERSEEQYSTFEKQKRSSITRD